MMIGKEKLKEEIEAIGIRPEDTVLIHSSMRAVGPVEGGADTVLDAFSEYLRDGLLVLPTHSWATITFENNFFDYRVEPSCVGLLSNLFRLRPGVIRSLHPTHSVAALGKDAEAFTDGEENSSTPCGRNGCWGKLLDRGAKVLFLGCDVSRNTFLHGVEEWNDIPDRLTPYAKPYRILLREDGGRPRVVERLHRRHHSDLAQHGDVSVHYGKIMPLFLREGAAVSGRIGEAASTLADCRGMYELTSEQLKRNPMLFNDFTPIGQD